MLASLRARVARCERSTAPTANSTLQRPRLAPATPRPLSSPKTLVAASAAAEAAQAPAPPVDPLPPLTPGDAVVQPGPALSVRASEPFYEFTLRYAARYGGPLFGARRVIAHYGHSGWRNARDAEMRPSTEQQEGVWEATVRVPASALPSVGHAELQVAFRGLLPRNNNGAQGTEQQGDEDEALFEEWDNNDGANWAVAVELDTERGHGLAAAPPELMTQGDPEAARWLKSSLLLRVDALAAARALSSEQAALLRALAWAGDFSLLRAYAPLMHSSDDAAVAAALARRCGALSRGRPGVHTVHVCTEAAPFAKVGGLGDVTTALAKSHQASGALVELVLPKFDVGDYSSLQGLRVVREMVVPWGGNGGNGGGNNGNGKGNGNSGHGNGGVRTLVWSALMDGLPVYLVEPLDGRFWRNCLYGCPDDAERFAFFSRAALEFLALPPRGQSVDVIHIHDYHTAPIAVMMKEGVVVSNGNGNNGNGGSAHPSLSPSSLRARLPRARTVLTLHNLAFQGTGPEAARAAEAAGLPPGSVCRGSHNNAEPNFLRAGILAADRVTTVSPNYAREVLSDAQGLGMGLSPALREAAARGAFKGVLNGIDKAAWSPEQDPHLPARYSASDLWRGKSECKRQLLREVGLPWEHVGGDIEEENEGRGGERMLLAVISRLTDQKGLPLILRGIARAASTGAQVVVLGSAPDPVVQRDFERRAAEAAMGGDVRFVLRHDEALAHRLYAAADALLVPSLFEPCGLTQLIALRYGCVPVVRRTGGLADTVFDVAHDYELPEAQRNGFVFEGDDVEAAVGRAVDAYTQGRGWWREELVPRLMRADHGWARSGREYLELYREAAAGA
jgi:ADP-glucose type glycogen/starch synthase